MPIIPLVVTPDGNGIQDSTPIIEAMEKLYPDPSIHPDDSVTGFISALIEEFGDEWGNKWMFHYRWARDVDQISSAGRIARMRSPNATEQEHAALTGEMRARMVDRVWFVGSNAETAPQIEAGFLDMLGLLDKHLASRPYLFGGRPAFGDFGLWGQIYEMWTDPTAGALIGGGAPHVLDWVHRMLWPRAEGTFETWPDAGADFDADPGRTSRTPISALELRQSNRRLRRIAANSASRSTTGPGPRSHKNITPVHLACCARNMPPFADKTDSIRCWQSTGCLTGLRT